MYKSYIEILVIILFFIIFFKSNLGKEYNKENLVNKNITIRIITLCTPNYDKIGCYGANSLKYYCNKHNYKFSLYRKKKIHDLHINFSKNAIIIDACKKFNEDYIVCVDSDIIIKNYNKKLESIFTPGKILYGPKDVWIKGTKGNSIINAGFIIWKNCERTIELNKKWLSFARNECKKWSDKHPRQQNVFDKCLYKLIKKDEIEYLDHNLVGVPYSTFIQQNKKPKIGWEKIGKPNYKICMLK